MWIVSLDELIINLKGKITQLALFDKSFRDGKAFGDEAFLVCLLEPVRLEVIRKILKCIFKLFSLLLFEQVLLTFIDCIQPLDNLTFITENCQLSKDRELLILHQHLIDVLHNLYLKQIFVLFSFLFLHYQR